MSDDATLGGYLKVHERPPSFQGADGRAYSADVYVDEVPGEDGRYGAAVIFVRWSDSGEHVVGHLETSYLAFADTATEATDIVRGLSLHEVKRYLDQAIAAAEETRH